ncbi:MerR family transcriptional regulator [Glycomyces harbinensis]|uniref:DNA-binding transcriptional regulator, MerR family n=1 Tax=Glycomyces harbinensis TaxID=58114 RepID=A0A1G6RS91_9ACTN|nr:MerR family transcriptional regulator [Glycomyces harbinensis]SDD07428.1 DNA-binding transcriptional regulator, MerR family [Glycomyces harbinensis]
MRIGELAERTGASPRLLRYYEQHGLITAERSPNGYRHFGEDDVARVGRVRDLLEAGIPIKIIKLILPCLSGGEDIHFPVPDPGLLAQLEEQRDRMTRKAECVLKNRDAIAAYLDRVRGPAEPARD